MTLFAPNITTYKCFCTQVGGPKAAPFEPLDFLQVGGPFREVGGHGLLWLYGNSSTGPWLRLKQCPQTTIHFCLAHVLWSPA